MSSQTHSPQAETAAHGLPRPSDSGVSAEEVRKRLQKVRSEQSMWFVSQKPQNDVERERMILLLRIAQESARRVLFTMGYTEETIALPKLFPLANYQDQIDWLYHSYEQQYLAAFEEGRQGSMPPHKMPVLNIVVSWPKAGDGKFYKLLFEK